MQVANKTDDSGFCSGIEYNSKIKALMGSGMTSTGKVLLYSLRAYALHMASHSKEVSRASFDAYLNENASWSGVAELMGGEALLWDCTTAAKLKQLHKLANEQIQITHCFDTKFSNTVFHLLQKMQEAFVGTGGIVKKFINDMATAGLNFIRDTSVYEAELSASDGVAFAAGLAKIRVRIAWLIREPQSSS